MAEPFPVDDVTLDLLHRAVRPPEDDAEQSSLFDLLALMDDMAGEDAGYHPNDVIAALVDEVRRLRT